MSIPATPALARFELEKDDPKVEGLKYFILSTLQKRLEQVLYWNISPYEPGVEDTRSFSLELMDGCQIKGVLHRQTTHSDRLHTRPGEPEDKWSVGDDWKCVF